MISLKKSNNGITLIALVITIIVLLILAGIAIAMLTGNNGILDKTTTAKHKTEEAEVKEAVELMVQDYNIGKHTNQEENIKKYFQKQAARGEISRIVDNKDNTYTVEKDGYQVLIDENGKIQSVNEKEKVEVTEVWYKIDETTLHLSSYDLGGYTKYDESLSTPEWAGQNASNTSPITKIVFENKIAPTSTKSWFQYLRDLIEIENIENLDTSNVTNMSGMFVDCNNLLDLDLSSFDTTKVTSMSMMFAGDSEKMNIRNIDLSSFNTSNVNNMMAMFYQCSQLNNLDLNSFDTRNVTNMAMMFMGCKSLSCLDLTTFYTSNVAQSTWMIGKNVTCPIYIGENWTLTEVETGYTGTFQRK